MSPTAYKMLSIAIREISKILVFFIALTSGVLALSGVSEIESRHNFRILLQERIENKQADIAAIASKKTPLTIEGWDVDALQSQVSDLFAAKLSLRQLSETGASTVSETLRNIKLKFLDHKDAIDVITEDNFTAYVDKLGYVPVIMRDDSVLAGVMIFSSLFGACLATLRSGQFKFGNIALGSASGILVFFLIKGGKMLFFQSEETTLPQYNPYSFAVAGILAGLFTESAYRTLAATTESLLARVQEAVKPKE